MIPVLRTKISFLPSLTNAQKEISNKNIKITVVSLEVVEISEVVA